MIVPAMPPLPDDLLVEHASDQQAFSSSLDGASEHVRRLFVMLQRRIFIESLAYVQSVRGTPDDQLLLPPPRAFLTRTQEMRCLAAAAAFRYLDSRAEMLRQGLVERLIEPGTPTVLHALMEGVAPSGVETNAGMVRATPTAWKPEANSFMHPPAGMCRDLLDAAMDMAMHAPAPAVARAGWLTFTVLSIHPFVDGNGRTSRTVFHLVAMEDPNVAFDWGIAEQWAVGRRAYVAALQAGQQVEAYDGALMDAGPFMRLCVEQSAFGARVCRARVDRLTVLLDRILEDVDLDPEAAMLALAVGLWRVATLDELDVLGLVGEEQMELVEQLIDRGVIAWGERPPSRRTRLAQDVRGLRASDRLVELVR